MGQLPKNYLSGEDYARCLFWKLGRGSGLFFGSWCRPGDWWIGWIFRVPKVGNGAGGPKVEIVSNAWDE